VNEKSGQRSPEALAAIFSDVPFGFCTFDLALRHVFVNDWLAALNGLPAADHVGRTIHEVIPHASAAVEAKLRQVLETGAPAVSGEIEAGLPLSSGERRLVQYTWSPIRDGNAEITGVSCLVQDVAKQQPGQADGNRARDEGESAALSLESDERFRDFAEAASDWFWETDADNRYTYLSDRFYETTGDPPASIIGKTAADVGRTLAAFGVESEIREAIAAHRPYQNAVSWRIHADGRKHWVRSGAIPRFDADGVFLGYRGVSADITAEVDAREAARTAESRFFDAMDHMLDHVCLYDSDDRLIHANDVARQHRLNLYGRDFIGETFEEFCRATLQYGHVPDAVGREEAWLEERMARHRQPGNYFRVHGQGETEFWHEIREHRMPDGGTLVAWVDVTDFVVQEQQLRQAQKMEAVGQITGGVAHDFNNVLAVILGNLELIRKRNMGSAGINKFLTPAITATKRGAALTHRLLAFARKQTLNIQDVDVEALLYGMDDMLRRSLGETIEISVVNASDLWLCEVDAAQLEQAILNLAVNAHDAMPDGGRLTIETFNTRIDEIQAAEQEAAPGEYVSLAITDTGTGMTADVREQIFDPFFTTKGVGKGTGLGLSMVFGFVKQSGGHVAVDSEWGHGTTFRLYLPRSSAAAATPETAGTSDAPLAKPGEAILVVEDDANLQLVISDMLETLGYSVAVAGTGGEALELLPRLPRMDLLLTDVVLAGGISGPALVNAVRQKQADTKVLYMSGYTEEAFAKQGRLDPAIELLTKPFAIEELGNRLRSILDN